MQTSFLGQLLAHRYRVISPLAAGGFGQTYIAEDTQRPSHPKCVVKHLTPASSDLRFLENARRLFATEAETLEKLGNHDQIPRLLAKFEENEEFFLVQELIEGHPLANELSPGKRWSESQVYCLLWQVLNVLVFVHQNNVIHRDIKPENLLRRDLDHQLVLVDFGTVKQIRTQIMFQGQPTATISIGTPGYMPTEQSHGRPRPNSDIYALGMIGIQAVTGLMPMQLPEDVETGELLWQDQSQISNELSNILARMTRYHFKDRYQSATEVLQDLESLMNDRGIVPISPGILAGMPLGTSVGMPAEIPPEISDESLQPTVISENNTQSYHKTIIALSPTVISQKPVISQEPINDYIEKAITELDVKAIAQPKAINLEPLDEIKIEQIVKPIVEQIVEPEITNREPTFEIELEPTDEPRPSEPEPTAELTMAIASEADSAPKPQTLAGISPRWLVGAGALILGTGVIAGGIYFVQRQAYVRAQNDLKQVEVLQAAGKYEECVQQAGKIAEKHLDLQAQAQGLMGDCLLTQAEALAKQRKFKDAIAQTRNISPHMRAYSQAQKLTNQWSEAILKTATEQYRQGNLQEAKAIAQAIPPNVAIAPKTKQTIQQWQSEWQKNEEILKAAQKSLTGSQWQKALDQVNKLRILGQPVSQSSAYWKTQVKEIATKANQEIDAIAQREAIAAAKAAARSAQQAPASSHNNGYSGSDGYSDSGNYSGSSGGSGNGGSSGGANYPAAAPPSAPSGGGSGGGWIERQL